MHVHVGERACRLTTALNKHTLLGPWGCSEVSDIQCEPSTLCVLPYCADRTVHIYTSKQMENSIRKPQGSNFTNVIFTLQARPVLVLRAQLIHFVLSNQF